MSSKSPKPLHVLRGLLRLTATPKLPEDLLKKHGPLSTMNTTREYILTQYRANQTMESSAERNRLRALAANYHRLQQDLKERKRLYELDTGAEVILGPKEMSRRAAARAGLQLPELNPELERSK